MERSFQGIGEADRRWGLPSLPTAQGCSMLLSRFV
jgi:hypothetical protein